MVVVVVDVIVVIVIVLTLVVILVVVVVLLLVVIIIIIIVVVVVVVVVLVLMFDGFHNMFVMWGLVCMLHMKLTNGFRKQYVIYIHIHQPLNSLRQRELCSIITKCELSKLQRCFKI